MYVKCVEDAEEVAKLVRDSGACSVRVASEMFWVESGGTEVLLAYLRECVERRFVPWVFISDS